MENKKIHLLSLDMGYGHQRAAYPLVELSKGGIIAINDYPNINEKEKKYWQRNRQAYEKISYFKKVPIIGSGIFNLMDYFQRIDSFYPIRSLTKQTWQQKNFIRKIKLGLGKKLINDLNQDPLPIVSTFFVGAYMAEYHGYQGDIYCLLCDADVSRAWAMPKASKSKVRYLVPTKIAADRLKMYGVRPEMIIKTGFPLPIENIGSQEREATREDLAVRLVQLDPEKKYRYRYDSLLKAYLPPLTAQAVRPLTITFAVGGAGAQRELGSLLLKKLKAKISKEKIKLNLMAACRKDVYKFFTKAVYQMKLEDCLGVNIFYYTNKAEYFYQFNKILRETDILWTKPSELSFYSALGLPLIITQPVGAQEYKNRDWLLSIGAAHDGLDLKTVDQWLFDWLKDGRLARAAMDAYLNAPYSGTYEIKKLFS